MSRSEELFRQAVELIPGGVNSPVRAYGNVHEIPRFIVSAEGPYISDVDGNTYVDYIGSWGPMILGNNDKRILDSVVKAAGKGLSFGAATEAEVEMAQLVCDLVPSIEMVRMVNSGTEAVMSALRVARGYTGRNKIVKFMGCYHGHTDAMLVKAGSGVMTAGIPDSAGVPAGCTQDTLSAEYNNLDSVKELFDSYPDEIAAVTVEPVAANMGVVPPEEGFLEGLRALCDKYSALLIFDEVITGFRLSLQGAQGYFGIQPDLTTFGKIIGAGMPVGAYGGRKEIMQLVSPVGKVYQAGTLSGNPVAMAAGLTQLKILRDTPDFYEKLNADGDWFYTEMDKILTDHQIPHCLNHVGSLGCVFFTDKKVKDYVTAKTSDTEVFAKYFKYLLSHGIYMAPSQFEAIFLSGAHTKEKELKKTLEVIDACCAAIK